MLLYTAVSLICQFIQYELFHMNNESYKSQVYIMQADLWKVVANLLLLLIFFAWDHAGTFSCFKNKWSLCLHLIDLIRIMFWLSMKEWRQYSSFCVTNESISGNSIFADKIMQTAKINSSSKGVKKWCVSYSRPLCFARCLSFKG